MTGYIVIREIVIHLAEAVFYDSKTNIAKFQFNLDCRVQRKLILQLALGNLKHLSYSTFVILILRKIFACPSGKLSTEFTSRITKSIRPGMSDTTFFARWDTDFNSLVTLLAWFIFRY